MFLIVPFAILCWLRNWSLALRTKPSLAVRWWESPASCDSFRALSLLSHLLNTPTSGHVKCLEHTDSKVDPCAARNVQRHEVDMHGLHVQCGPDVLVLGVDTADFSAEGRSRTSNMLSYLLHLRLCVQQAHRLPQIDVSASLSIFQIDLIISEIRKMYPAVAVPLLPLYHSGQLTPQPRGRHSSPGHSHDSQP